MQRKTHPYADDIRSRLLDKADRFQRITGMPPSTIGKMAVNDRAFLGQVVAGRNVTLRTYNTFMCWLDQNLPPPLYVRKAKSSRRRKKSA